MSGKTKSHFVPASRRSQAAVSRLIFALFCQNPKNDGAGWVIFGAFDGKGNSVAAYIEWDLLIHLVCMKAA